MSLLDRFNRNKISIAPLITFRVLFGFIMAVSIARFAAYGWIEDLYVTPTFYFTFYGFDWVQPFSETGMYFAFGWLFINSICILLGFFYRVSIISFFLLFTYIELIDITNYLNHYYFVSVMSFLMIWLPAHRKYSLDVNFGFVKKIDLVPALAINVIKFQMGLVYFLAGVAKLNPYWLFEAMPLKLWLPAKSHVPIIGILFQYKWVAYIFSWFGALYDLTIAFFLNNSKTRVLAYSTVVIFHVLTAILFQIGMFPYIMMLSTLIYFSASSHEKIQNKIANYFTRKRKESLKVLDITSSLINKKAIQYLLVIFLMIQILVPFRYLLYPGDLFWNEQGYRFSWRVMLMEKAGHATFRIEDDLGKKEFVQNYDYLTPQQEKMMSTQPDMMLQFAHHLYDVYKEKGFKDPKVYCTSKVTLNGRRSQAFTDPAIDLAKQARGFSHKNWIFAFKK